MYVYEIAILATANSQTQAQKTLRNVVNAAVYSTKNSKLVEITFSTSKLN